MLNLLGANSADEAQIILSLSHKSLAPQAAREYFK
jgi:hypothetical protein